MLRGWPLRAPATALDAAAAVSGATVEPDPENRGGVLLAVPPELDPGGGETHGRGRPVGGS
jgi:hypothetical protein